MMMRVIMINFLKIWFLKYLQKMIFKIEEIKFLSESNDYEKEERFYGKIENY
jgi:hypothetical protein